MKRMVAAAGVSLMLLLGACGSDDDKVETANDAGGAGQPAGGADAQDTPTSSDAMPGSDTPEETTPEIVTPRPGMTNLRPVAWEKAESLSERTVLVTFYGGVEPCDVLDSVTVKYGAKNVTISLFSGSDPKQPDAVCIEIAKLKAVAVDLGEDLDGRRITDGAPGSTSTGSGDPGTAPDAPLAKGRGDAPATGLAPVPGQAQVRPMTWNRYETVGSDLVRVFFMSGPAPCTVFDSVKVTYAEDAIRIALFVGSDPKQPDAVCPAIAELSYADIHLKEPVGDRTIVDAHQTD